MKEHALLYTFKPYTNVWEIYKVTDRRRAHVQFPWNIHENKPLSRMEGNLVSGFLRLGPGA